MTTDWARQVLEPRFMRGLDQLVLRQRRSRRATGGGARAPAVRASGLDWIDHRPYEQGDDLRYVDWQLYSRIGKPWVRRFQAEGCERIDILLDVSLSMTVGRPPKSDVASAIAFCFGYVALALGERVAATLFSDGVVDAVPAGRGPSHRARLLDGLVRARSNGGTDIGRSLRSLADRGGEIGRAIVISDLLDESYKPGLEALRARGFEVAIVRTRSAEEERPEIGRRDVELIDIETGSRRSVRLDAGVLDAYQATRSRETNELHRTCAEMAIPIACVDTSRNLIELVFSDLRRAGMLG